MSDNYDNRLEAVLKGISSRKRHAREHSFSLKQVLRRQYHLRANMQESKQHSCMVAVDLVTI